MSNKKPVHVMRMPIRWGDMDMMGHVNNTVYFRYIESARIAWLEECGGMPPPAALTEGPVIAHAQCAFFKELKYPGDIEITTYASVPGRSSFEMTHEIRRVLPDGSAGEVHAEAAARVVWVDFTAGKSAPLPERIRAVLPAA